ncbi:pentatricopeptide repeat-containing protein At4g02750-like [Selaginella moellendorffii]|uniref:pentatricopeptide repeat-containing protein At4g02750-like n=1 Tax=Selaginella moellendorffii TaxID=88036 RepID=UPI000D1C9956|nr:pentatricopeptide repeat-containing protein At4g02750-like [Selaginella moellendorffii]|eukprot:XP_024532079.1 pentatricopeptide repeat-containing protein At4g02750-like [Selaginella moellendorffii]
MPEQNIVAWNAMITAFAQIWHFLKSRIVFDKMPVWDHFSCNALIAAYTEKGFTREGSKLREAKVMFDGMPGWDLPSWFSMIIEQLQARGGSILLGQSPTAKRGCVDFHDPRLRFQQPGRGSPDPLHPNSSARFHLLDCDDRAYAQNDAHAARAMFDRMPERHNVVAWTAMIQAYTLTGNFFHALILYQDMVLEGMAPDQITFTGILISCSWGSSPNREPTSCQCVETCGSPRSWSITTA